MIGGIRPTTEYFVDNFAFDSVLDVGCGKGDLWPVLAGKTITGVDFKAVKGAGVETIQADFMAWLCPKPFDAVVCSHMVEHMSNTAQFLTKLLSCVADDGAFCIIWPPYKSKIVSGHVHIFNFGLMLYNLIRLGFDCREVKMVKCAYSEAVMGRKKLFEVPKLTHNEGDIERLAPWFPFPAKQSFEGSIVPGVLKLGGK